MTIEDAAASQADARSRLLALMRENGHFTRRHFRRKIARIGLTMSEARTLLYLELQPEIMQARLAELLDTQPIALSRVIDRLERAGWLSRQASETDRRVRLLSLTADGARMVGELHAISHAIDSDFGRELPVEVLNALSKALADFNTALRGAADD